MSKTSSAKIDSEDSTATPPLAVSRLRVRNFKAIRDSGTVHFSPLTAFIGNNGVGKSSLVEALEMLHDIANGGLQSALNRWRGFDFIRNGLTTARLQTTPLGRLFAYSPVSFRLRGASESPTQPLTFQNYDLLSAISGQVTGRYLGDVFFREEILIQDRADEPKRTIIRHRDGKLEDSSTGAIDGLTVSLFKRLSILRIEESPIDWQFVRFQPESMMQPQPVREASGYLSLATDGSNIAEFLLDIRNRDEAAFNGIVETLQMVLPYAVDIQTVITSETERDGYLRLHEKGLKDPLPSWLLSTGTLRVVALLALLRHPEPPPLIVIEEIENGLDPRTIHLLVEEMRYAVENGITQIILTTHSPYLLDLLSLSQIVVVERDATGEPKFFRPGDDAALDKWSAQFTPGQLYTMGRLGRGGK